MPTKTLLARLRPIVIIGASLLALPVSAAPEAHILRIDPRASQTEDAPVLTTVIEVVQNKRMSDVTGPCATLSGNGFFDCLADRLEQPQALYSPFDFPEGAALFTVSVGNGDLPATFVSKERWGAAQKTPGAGTAWLVLIDAAASMGSRVADARAVATAFVDRMGPSDIIDVMVFNDRAVVSDSRWLSDKQKAKTFLGNVDRAFPAHGRTRPLFDIIKKAATDGFKELGNAGTTTQVPLHQAMVVLSNGSAGADPSSNPGAAALLQQYLTKGRFPEDNSALPKSPVPVISVWFPTKQIEEFQANAREFMEGLANPEIGGFFSLVRQGQEARAPRIVDAVRARFSKMWIVKWRVACVSPSVEQTFKLVFRNTNPPIAGDATFKAVPVGIDPSTWPLDIDRAATEREAQKNPVYPGGKVKLLGNFCWGGDKGRAEIYAVPKNQALPASLQTGSIEDAQRAQRTLIESGMRGESVSVGDGFAQFELPNDDRFLLRQGEGQVARLIIYDNAARRTSWPTADRVLTLRAQAAPLPYLWIGVGSFAFVVLALLAKTAFGRGRAPSATAANAQVPHPMAQTGNSNPPIPAPAVTVGPPPAVASRASLSSAQGIFTIIPSMEMKAGRDGAICQILLTEPRVSSHHASFKLEGGQLYVQDQGSHNGTFVAGQKQSPHAWCVVPHGANVRLGPVEMIAKLEG